MSRSAWATVLSILCGSFVSVVPLSGQEPTRQIEVRVLDENERPLAGAQLVMSAPKTAPDIDRFIEPSELNNVEAKIVRGSTGDDGSAVLDVQSLGAVPAEQSLSLLVWKPGYVAKSFLVHSKATLQLELGVPRRVQVLSEQGEPAVGVRVVAQAATNELPKQSEWQAQNSGVTDDLGIAILPAVSPASVTLNIEMPNGIVHRMATTGISVPGLQRMLDPRDLLSVRLSEHGSIEGQLPPKLVDEFIVRVQDDQDTGDFRARLRANLTSITPEVKVEPSGQFVIEHVVAGRYLLVLQRRQPFTASTSVADQQPSSVQRLTVQAGQATKVDFTFQPTAIVRGRVRSDATDTDVQGRPVIIYESLPSTRPFTQPTMIARASCASDGSFEARLPPGNYEIGLDEIAFRGTKRVPVLIGPGAASVTVDDLQFQATRTVTVRMASDQLPKDLIALSSGLGTVQLMEGDRFGAACALSVDGHGRMEMPLDTKAYSIVLRSVAIPQRNSLMQDLDPTEDFELAYDMQTTGIKSNVELHGRVTDASGKGLANLPLDVSLTYSMIDSRMRGMLGGSQYVQLDKITTRQDGTYRLPPKQMFRMLTIPGRQVTDQGKLIVSVSTKQSLNEIVAQKEMPFSPETWNEHAIELPDLIIPQLVERHDVSGTMMDKQGQPLSGKTVWIVDRQVLLRTVTNGQGAFSFPDVMGPSWLFRKHDWSIRRLEDLSAPIEWNVVDSDASESSDRAPGIERMSLEQRLKLAKKNLDELDKLGAIMSTGRRLPAEAYLEREKFLERLKQNNSASMDEMRSLFVDFWTTLTDQEINDLADATRSSYFRAKLLMKLADRHPDRAAYERVMTTIDFASGGIAGQANYDLIAEVGVKLHHLGGLEAQRDKLRQALSAWSAEQQKVQKARQALPAQLGRMQTEPLSIRIISALLDPESYKESYLADLQLGEKVLIPLDPTSRLFDNAILLRLYPQLIDQFPAVSSVVTETIWHDLGKYAPRETLAMLRNSSLETNSIRQVAASALETGHNEAAELTRECIDFLLADESYARPSRIQSANDPVWYDAARRASPELGRQVAWFAAFDYFRGHTEPSTISLLPFEENREMKAIFVAYCLREAFPDLGRQLIEQATPRVMKQLEKDAQQSYSRRADVSYLVYLAPEATLDVLDRMGAELNEKMKAAAGKRDIELIGRVNAQTQLRLSALRGLLLEKL